MRHRNIERTCRQARNAQRDEVLRRLFRSGRGATHNGYNEIVATTGNLAKVAARGRDHPPPVRRSGDGRVRSFRAHGLRKRATLEIVLIVISVRAHHPMRSAVFPFWAHRAARSVVILFRAHHAVRPAMPAVFLPKAATLHPMRP